MRPDVFADLDHLFMLNFSVSAEELSTLVPSPLQLLTRHGRGFPSIVLPRIRNLRPARLGVPRVHYELYGLRILVEFESARLGRTKGIWFQRLIMDPNPLRWIANAVTPFQFERGCVTKRCDDSGWTSIVAEFASGEPAVHAEVCPSPHYPDTLTDHSCFSTSDEALAMYNDIAFGFLVDPARCVHILQIAEPHPNYVAWPLRHLQVRPESVRVPRELTGMQVQLEPSYYVGSLPRYWRWLPSERFATPRCTCEPG